MDDEIQEAPEAPAPAPVPEPGPPSRDQLIGALAESYGLTPEDIAGSIQLRDQYARASAEVDRKMRDLEQRERSMREERDRARFQNNMEFADPNQKVMYEMMMEMREDRRRDQEERQREREETVLRQRQVDELGQAYEAYMQAIPTHQRVDAQRFFDNGMAQLYPQGVPEGMSVRQAVANTGRFLGLQSTGYNGNFQQPQPNPRDRRASIVLPGPTTTSYQGGQTGMITGEPIGQRDGETIEQYRDRLERYVREQSMSLNSLPEGRRFTSG